MSIELSQGTLVFYGNLAGFVEQGRIIVDPIFRSGELEVFLEKQELAVEWRDGVFEQMAFGLTPQREQVKNCRIWQLKPHVDPRLRFVELEQSRRISPPDPANYRLAYEGCFHTNDPEEIYSICCQELPDGYQGHPLTVSDVVELYDAEGSRFYYADRVGFQEIEFKSK